MTDHEWCRDVRRDEQVRAAEDAANWRRLEVGDVVQAGDQYRNCWGWQSVPTTWYGQVLCDGFWHIRRRVPSASQHRDLPEVVADLRERVARLEGAAKTAAKESPAVVANTCGDGGCGPARSGQNSGQAELEAAPPPRGWLTEEERDAVDHAADIIEEMEDPDGNTLKPKADALRALLAREAPPRVKVPPVNAAWVDFLHERDGKWIAAIRAAGGEVE